MNTKEKKNFFNKINFLVTIIVLSVASLSNCDSKALYKDPKYSTKKRVNNLLRQMTLKEKAGQLSQLSFSSLRDKTSAEDRKKYGDYMTLDLKKGRNLIVTNHVGSIILVGAYTPENNVEFIQNMQKLAIEETRLKIPLLIAIDHMHGASYLLGGTYFPQGYTLSGSFNTNFTFEMAKITVLESAHLGHRWVFGPVLDLFQDPLWARCYETAGESTYLAARTAESYVKGIQAGNKITAPHKVAATAKHFLGYSNPMYGWDRHDARMSWQHLHEFHRPSFQAAVDAGIKTIMVNSGSINGVPVHASKPILTDLLRKTMGFKGLVLTDWGDINKLDIEVLYARDNKHGAELAVNAGIDMSMTPHNMSFSKTFLGLIKEGILSKKQLDAAVRKVLTLKFDLGIFEAPYPDPKHHSRIGKSEHKQIALEAAQESIALLKNDTDLLPLEDKGGTIIVTGISANSKRNLCGGWAIRWQGGPDKYFPKDMHTVYTAMKSRFTNSNVKLLDVNLESLNTENDRARVVKEIKAAKYVIVTAGDLPYAEGPGTTSSLDLQPEQKTLIRLATANNEKSILVLIQSRPNTYGDIMRERLEPDAVLHAGLPGLMGADAIADIIIGKVNPSGRITFNYPSHPNSYHPHNAKKKVLSYAKISPDIKKRFYRKRIAYPFGHGLSYTTFEYADLRLINSTVSKKGTLTGSIKVKNIGEREGKESVLFFLSDERSSIVMRPWKKLFHFEKISLKPGESKTIPFTIDARKNLSFPDANGNPILESGEFKVLVGGFSVKFNLQ